MHLQDQLRARKTNRRRGERVNDRHSPRSRTAEPRRLRGTLEHALGQRTARTASTRPAPPRGLLDRHSTANGFGSSAHRPRLLLHANRHRRPLLADARQGRLLPDRLGRQRPRNRATRPELLRCPLRPDASRTTRRSALPRNRRRSRSRSRGRTSSSCATSSRTRTSRRSRTLFRRLGLSVDWSTKYTTISRSAQRTSQLAFLHLVEAVEPTARRRRRCGTSTSGPPSPRPSSKTARSPASYHRVRFRSADDRHADRDRNDPSRAASRRASLSSRIRRQKARGPVRQTAVTPLFGVEVPVSPTRSPIRRRAPASRWSARSATSPTSCGGASSRLADPHDRRARRPIRAARRSETPGWESTRPRRARTSATRQSKGSTVRQARPRIVELLAAIGRPHRRAAPDHPPREVLREGRAPARDRRLAQWYVRTMERRDQLIDAGREIEWHPDSCAPATSRGSRA